MAASTRSFQARAMRLPALAAVLLATGCSTLDSVGSSISSGFDSLLPSFSGPRNTVASDSLTIQRIRGANPTVEPIVPESGNVWPDPEAPRPTLMSGPDEAMRNIPNYSPAPAASSPVPTPPERPVARRGSSTPPGALPPQGESPRSPVAQPFAPPTPPDRSAVGSVTTDPSGRPATITGQAGRLRSYSQPGVGGGQVIRDGNVETWIGPDGQARTRVVPQ